MNRPIRILFAGMESTSVLSAAASFARTWVRVDVTVPGHELIANRVQHEDVNLALSYAFEDMERQLAGIDTDIHHVEYAVTIPGSLLPQEDNTGER